MQLKNVLDMVIWCYTRGIRPISGLGRVLDTFKPMLKPLYKKEHHQHMYTVRLGLLCSIVDTLALGNIEPIGENFCEHSVASRFLHATVDDNLQKMLAIIIKSANKHNAPLVYPFVSRAMQRSPILTRRVIRTRTTNIHQPP